MCCGGIPLVLASMPPYFHDEMMMSHLYMETIKEYLLLTDLFHTIEYIRLTISIPVL